MGLTLPKGSDTLLDTPITFGKYRGQPAAAMLADTSYMDWLAAQPRLVAQFGNLLALRDQANDSSTPEHNRLQTLFLDPAYREALVRHLYPSDGVLAYFVDQARKDHALACETVETRRRTERENVRHDMSEAEWQRRAEAIGDAEYWKLRKRTIAARQCFALAG